MRIRLRRARPEDGDAVREITRSTFDGWDYVADVWDTWLAARDGAVFAAELVDDPGRPVAIGRLTLLAPDEAWLEGLRVDPRVRGRGVATAFQNAVLAWARAQAGIVRYATGETNEGSLRLGAIHGFAEAGRWRAIRPLEEGISAAHRASGNDPAATLARADVLLRLGEAGLVAHRNEPAWTRLAEDPTFAVAGALYEWRAWAWQALTAKRLAGHLARGDVLVARDGDTWALGLLANERLLGETRLALLGGDPLAALRLVEAVGRAVGDRPTLRLPDGSPLLEGIGPRLADQGWRVGEHVLVIMHRALRDDAGSPLELPPDGADRVVFEEEPRPLGLVPAD